MTSESHLSQSNTIQGELFPMRVAYADPPYPGQSFRCYGDHPDYAGEVDHRELLDRLMTYDAWVLHTSASALPEVLALCPYSRGTDPKNPGRVEPNRSVRIVAWVKRGIPPRPVSVQYAWEPILLFGGRDRRHRGFLRDWIACEKRPGGIIGSKPAEVCEYVFEALGLTPADELDDLFPGSGAVTAAWKRWCGVEAVAA